MPISKLQYEQLRLFMSTREAQMRGKRVLAPRMAVGLFFNGTIKTKSEQLRKFLIWFANGDLEPVCLCHLILKPPEHAWAGDDVVSGTSSFSASFFGTLDSMVFGTNFRRD